MAVIRHQLTARKSLGAQRIRMCNYCLIVALIGIAFMVIDNEICAHGWAHKTDGASYLLRSLACVSTAVLLVLVFMYHHTEIELLKIDSGTDDWRVAITWDRVGMLLLEEFICVICPVPGTGFFHWQVIDKDHRTVKYVEVPVDVVLSIPMFLRSYLLCRFMVLHSRQFQDAATRSIAALNNVGVDFKFVFKTMMMEEPLRVLISFTVVWWISLSWLMTQCERYNKPIYDEDYNYLNSLWFIVITFMSIGYGDIVPKTYCGRMLGITTGIFGIGVASALIAVISRKLELSRAEKHVNAFMADTKLARSRKDTAANVLQQTWFIYKYRSVAPVKDDNKIRIHQRKFLAAINEFRRIKWEQRRLAEQSNMLVDITKIEAGVRESICEMRTVQQQVLSELSGLNSRLDNLSSSITRIQPLLDYHLLNSFPQEQQPHLGHQDSVSSGCAPFAPNYGTPFNYGVPISSNVSRSANRILDTHGYHHHHQHPGRQIPASYSFDQCCLVPVGSNPAADQRAGQNSASKLSYPTAHGSGKNFTDSPEAAAYLSVSPVPRFLRRPNRKGQMSNQTSVNSEPAYPSYLLPDVVVNDSDGNTESRSTEVAFIDP